MYMSRLAAQKEWAFMKVSVDGLVLAWANVPDVANGHYNLDPPRAPVSGPTAHRPSTALYPHGGY